MCRIGEPLASNSLGHFQNENCRFRRKNSDAARGSFARVARLSNDHGMLLGVSKTRTLETVDFLLVSLELASKASPYF